MRTIFSFFIILFLLGGYASDILNAAPACTWRYKWVWDGSTRYACEVQVPDAGCGMNNGRQKRTAKCVREDGDGTSVAVAVANCATWDPYTGAKSLIETYDNGTCTMPCNAVCGNPPHTTNVTSQPASNLCDLTKTYSTGITWLDGTAVGPDYTYNWNCASKNGGSSASCWAGKQTNGQCDNSTALGCSIGSYTNDNSQTACDTTRRWNCSGLNGGGLSPQCSKANVSCCASNMGQSCNKPDGSWVDTGAVLSFQSLWCTVGPSGAWVYASSCPGTDPATICTVTCKYPIFGTVQCNGLCN